MHTTVCRLSSTNTRADATVVDPEPFSTKFSLSSFCADKRPIKFNAMYEPTTTFRADGGCVATTISLANLLPRFISNLVTPPSCAHLRSCGEALLPTSQSLAYLPLRCIAKPTSTATQTNIVPELLVCGVVNLDEHDLDGVQRRPDVWFVWKQLTHIFYHNRGRPFVFEDINTMLADSVVETRTRFTALYRALDMPSPTCINRANCLSDVTFVVHTISYAVNEPRRRRHHEPVRSVERVSHLRDPTQSRGARHGLLYCLSSCCDTGIDASTVEEYPRILRFW